MMISIGKRNLREENVEDGESQSRGGEDEDESEEDEYIFKP